jgi:hypothetical protein
MVRAHSPLFIPRERGKVFRVVFSGVLIALGIWIAVITVEGFRSGSLIWPSRHHPHIFVERIGQPTAFWTAAVVWITVCTWMLYASVAEILYATRDRKPRQPSNQAMQRTAPRSDA